MVGKIAKITYHFFGIVGKKYYLCIVMNLKLRIRRHFMRKVGELGSYINSTNDKFAENIYYLLCKIVF